MHILKFIFELPFYCIYQFCDKKAWFVSSHPENWATLTYTFYLYLFVSSIVICLGSLLSLDLTWFLSGGHLSHYLPEDVVSAWNVIIIMLFNMYYFLRKSYWKNVNSYFDVFSKKRTAMVYSSGACMLAFSFLFFMYTIFFVM